MLKTRRSTPEDVPALYRIWKDAVDATHGFVARDDLDSIDELVRVHYLPSASLLLAVDEEDRVLGFLGAGEDEIQSLFVAPEHHGRGVGRLLIAEVGRGKPILKVDVNEQNVGAVAFYLHLGFRIVGRSERDSSGFPYPLLHMERADDQVQQA